MILETFLNMQQSIFFTLFSWVNIPAFPSEVTTAFNDFLDLLFSSAGVLGFFIRPATLNIVIPLVIGIITFDKAYFIVMWVLKKIPFLSIR